MKERSIAEIRAEQLVADRGLRIPVDPFAIARGEQIAVVEKKSSGGVSGMFMRVGDDYVIAYAAHLGNVGFQRFSVAHELGHYFLPGHIEHVLQATDVHESQAGFTSKSPCEIEADQFAAGLLLPSSQFRALASHREPGLATIETLANDCQTSITATAIRLAQCSPDTIAVIVSGPDSVEFCFLSESFKALRGICRPNHGDSIARGTATYSFVSDPSCILHAERADGSVHLHEWFGGGPNTRLVEEVLGLGRYGRVLTVLTPEESIDPEEAEEDVALIDSWTPRFSRGRR